MPLDSDLKNTLALGIKCFNNKEYERAEQIFLQVIKQKDTLADVHNMLGLIYHDQGKFTKAIDEFTRALELNPNYTEASINLAVVSSDTGLHKEAKKAMDKVTSNHKKKKKGQMDPYVSGKLANMHAEIGDLYKSLGKIKEAHIEYDKALKLSPDFVDIWVKKANLLRDAKHYKKAIEIYKKAKRSGKSYSPIGLNLGITYYSQGHKKKAENEWKKVLENDPENKMAHSYMKLVKK